jgi:hypothetical protein
LSWSGADAVITFSVAFPTFMNLSFPFDYGYLVSLYSPSFCDNSTSLVRCAVHYWVNWNALEWMCSSQFLSVTFQYFLSGEIDVCNYFSASWSSCLIRSRALRL